MIQDGMVTHPASAQTALVRNVKLLSWLSMGWLLIDGAVGLAAGLSADSVVLIGWGLDCAIQSAASLVLIWRFSGDRITSAQAERLAQRAVGASFFLLAPYIIVEALHHLATGEASGASWIGIALAASDAILMPILGAAKIRAGGGLQSAATVGGGHQNVLCAYLSVAVLVGLAANALVGWWWADPIVALILAVAVVQSGVQTWRGRSCDTPTAAC
jgi:divalent metal cation (Fe/Co/Zn/Cd) transporter